MRILLVNKFLFAYGGAETAVARTAELLRKHGNEVMFFGVGDPRNTFAPAARELPRARTYNAGRNHRILADASAAVYSLDAARAIDAALAEFEPDVVHFHNVGHRLTMSIVDRVASAGVPTAMTLHDYKPVCPAYDLFRDGRLCRECVGASPLHVVQHRCMKGSLAASAVAAIESLIVRGRHCYGKVGRLIAPSAFLARSLRDGGLASERIVVLPNFVPQEWFIPSVDDRTFAPRPRFLFVGRLLEVKGIRLFLEVARDLRATADFLVIGDGPLRPLADAAHREGIVTYLGAAGWETVRERLDGATALIVPSTWPENCPMVVLEAGARGCPVIVTTAGGLPELVTDGVDGWIAEPSVEAIATVAARVGAGSSAQLRAVAERRLTRARDAFGEAEHYGRLVSAYAGAGARAEPSGAPA